MKNIFICTDGTWNRTLQTDRGELALSNVAKLARVIRTTKNQLVYYDQGVGTNAGLDKYTGGAFGHGLFENINQAYQFLIENYTNGDNILIFGFSRGAYTARSLAGLISEVGILRKKYISDIDSIFKMYRKKKKYEKPQLEQIKLATDEMVLTSCKTLDGLFNQYAGNYCGYLIQCDTIGS